MELFAGTSGFSYKEWKGRFYPEGLPESKMLSFYAERFRAVEINNTFYRMPKAELLTKWAAEAPKRFRFVLKASQRITHIKRLKESSEEVEYFFGVAESLGDQLGPCLFQLPPNMKKDAARLAAFLASVPSGKRVALEFRHPSWHDDEVFELLTAHGAALCVSEADEDEGGKAPPPVAPLIATAAFGYLRLRRVAYDEAALRTWIERIRAEPWTEAYVFFKHEDEATGPALASRFAEMFAQ